MKRRFKLTGASIAALVATVVIAMVVSPLSSGAARAPRALSKMTLSRMSSAAQFAYRLAHGQAPQARLLARAGATYRSSGPARSVAPEAATATFSDHRFNLDTTGLTQNEESVAACRANNKEVLMGQNDLAGFFLTPSPNSLTGTDFSTDGGSTVKKYAFGPPVSLAGTTVASVGDPAMAISKNCATLIGASLAFDLSGATDKSGIEVFRSTTTTMSSCTGFACWPTKRAVGYNNNDPSVFEDHEALDVGVSGAAGEVIWVTWTHFFGPAPGTSRIVGVRCNLALTSCTAPITISDPADSPLSGAAFTQFSDVKVAQDGQVYVTWVVVKIGLNGTQQFVEKIKRAGAGSTAFGASSVVHSFAAGGAAGEAVPFGGVLPGLNHDRVATFPRLEVMRVGTSNKLFSVYEACQATAFFGVSCQNPRVFLVASTTNGASWSAPVAISTAGVDAFFPDAAADWAVGGKLYVTWYGMDPDLTGAPITDFRHRYALMGRSVNPSTLALGTTSRLSPPTESNADALGVALGLLTIIGDYQTAFAQGGLLYDGFTAAYFKQKALGAGLPVHGQDNWLAVVTGL